MPSQKYYPKLKSKDRAVKGIDMLNAVQYTDIISSKPHPHDLFL